MAYKRFNNGVGWTLGATVRHRALAKQKILNLFVQKTGQGDREKVETKAPEMVKIVERK